MAVLIVNFKLIAYTRFRSYFLLLSVAVISFGLYIAYMWITNEYLSLNMYGTPKMFYTSAKMYFLLILCFCLLYAMNGYSNIIGRLFDKLMNKNTQRIWIQSKVKMPEEAF